MDFQKHISEAFKATFIAVVLIYYSINTSNRAAPKHATLHYGMYFYENVSLGYRALRDKSLSCVDIISFAVADVAQWCFSPLLPRPWSPYRWVSSSSGISSFSRLSKGTIQLSLNSPFSTTFFSCISDCTSITSSVGLSW